MNPQTDAADRESASLNAVAEPSEPARATLLRIGFGFAAAQSIDRAGAVLRSFCAIGGHHVVGRSRPNPPIVLLPRRRGGFRHSEVVAIDGDPC
jgi:hypothetical protein